MPKTPKLPERSPEEVRMLRKHDYVGLERYHCEQIRAADERPPRSHSNVSVNTTRKWKP